MDVEWVILADSAEVVNGKLYMLGGGWEVLSVAQPFPFHHTFAIATAYRVPWNETNQLHEIDIEIQTVDGEEVLKLGGQFEVGRPVGLPPGSDQRFPLAFGLQMEFRHPGEYVLLSRVEGEVAHRVTFRVLALAPKTT